MRAEWQRTAEQRGGRVAALRVPQAAIRSRSLTSTSTHYTAAGSTHSLEAVVDQQADQGLLGLGLAIAVGLHGLGGLHGGHADCTQGKKERKVQKDLRRPGSEEAVRKQ